ncbi:hypothetical protein [Sandaracinus amylolyticus]|nr:hypothetical protein [Sandaracinus amylolyticus]
MTDTDMLAVGGSPQPLASATTIARDGPIDPTLLIEMAPLHDP